MSEKVPFPDEIFFRELEGSAAWVDHVAKALQRAGVGVSVGKLVRRNDPTEIRDFTKNEVDLRLAGSRLVIEVKSRNLNWTTNANFPYGTMLVDTVGGFDAKLVLPLAYACISKQTSAISVISTATQSVWKTESRYDNVRGISDRFYECPKASLLNLDWLVELAKQLEGKDEVQRAVVLRANGFGASEIARMQAPT